MIVSFGCSFTFGDDLDDLPKWYNDFEDERNFMPQKEKNQKPSKKSYPYIIGQLLECNVENHGWRGGSNDRIFRKFFEHLLINNKPSTYIIQWTYPFRTEIWYSEGNYYWGVVPSFAGQLEEDLRGKGDISERYYKENFDEEESKKKLLRFMWSVDSLCEKFGHQLIQFLPLGKEDFDLENLPKTLLNTDKIRNLVNFEMHPTEKGHRRLAEYLTRRIKC